MFNSTKTYNVYAKKGSENPLEDVVLNRQGFNFFALIFHMFWALYKRTWMLFLIIFTLNVLLVLAKTKFGVIDEFQNGAIGLLINIWIGFEANNFRDSKLENSGYILFDVVTGSNETEALKRFYDKYLFNKEIYESKNFSLQNIPEEANPIASF